MKALTWPERLEKWGFWCLLYFVKGRMDCMLWYEGYYGLLLLKEKVKKGYWGCYVFTKDRSYRVLAAQMLSGTREKHTRGTTCR